MAGRQKEIESSFEDLLSGLDETDEKIDIDEFEIVSEDDITKSFFNDSKFTGSMLESPKVQIESNEKKDDGLGEQKEINIKPDLLNFDEPDEMQGSRGQTNMDIVSDIPVDDKQESENSENDEGQLPPNEGSDREEELELENTPVNIDLNDKEPTIEDEILVKVDTAEISENISDNIDKDLDAIFGSPSETNSSNQSKVSNNEDYTDHPDGDMDFGFVKGTDHLDVNSSKQKTSLVKKGSLARRKRPTRASIKRNVNDEDSKFQDATEPKKSPVNTEIKSDDLFVSSTPMNGELSPEADKPKKRSPVMIAMPGMTGLSPDKLKLSRRKQDFDTPSKDETDSKLLPMKLPYCSTPKTPEDTKNIDSCDTSALKGVSSDQKTSDERLDAGEISSPPFGSVLEKNSVPHSFTSDSNINKIRTDISDDLMKAAAKPPPSGSVSLKTKSDRKPANSYTVNDSSVSAQLKTPQLKKVSKDITSEKDSKEENRSGKFDIPALKVTESRSRSHSPSPRDNGFDRTPLKSSTSTTPYSKGRSTHDNIEDSVFQTPNLRSIKSSEAFQERMSKRDENKPTWLSDMKLKKTPSKNDEELSVKQNVETPSWMKTALDKKARMTEIMSKENASVDKKRLFSDTNQENRPSKPAPLQESRSDSRENIRNLPNSENTSAVITNLYPSADKKSAFKEEGRQSSRDREKYVPSWSKNSISKQGSFDKPSYLPPSSATLKSDDGIPPWKKELAERKKARRDTESSACTVKSTSAAEQSIPPWKREFSLKKRNSTSTKATEKETASTEPEWKKKADEKRSRLISSGVLEH